MDEYTRAIRQAQNLLRQKAETFESREIGYHQFEESPYKGAYHTAANLLEVLLVDEVDTNPSGE